MRKILICICLILLCVPSMAYAMPNTVTMTENTYSYYKNGEPAGFNKHAIFTSSTGNPVYCGNHGFPTPVGDKIGDSNTLEMHEYNNETVKKILYYGYLGPEEWEGFSDVKYNGVYKAYTYKDKRKWCGNAVTGMALTKTQGKGYFYNISGFEEFWEFISSAPSPPEGFKTYIMYGSNNQQNLFTWNYNPIGQLSLSKTATNNNFVLNECENAYSLEGAEYLVSSDKEFKNIVGRLTTDKEGNSNTISLKVGTYYIKESKSPKGFKLDEEIYCISLKEDQNNVLEISDEPLFNNMDLLLVKEDYSNGKGLEGAVFRVNYFDELTNNLTGKTPKKTWLFKTDTSGKISLDDKYKVGGDELYKDDCGNAIGLIGTYEIEEITPPKGYARNTNIVLRQVIQDSINSDTVYNPPVIKNVKQTISIILQKYEKTISDEVPATINEKSLEGAVYRVTDLDNNYIGEIVTDCNGKGILRNIPPGTYVIKEIKAPEGFLINPEEIIVDCEISDDTIEYLEYYITAEDLPEENQEIIVPLTGDIKDDTMIICYIAMIIAVLYTWKIYKKSSKN